MYKTLTDSVLGHRSAGVLLHPSSLPGKQKMGDIGQEARNFLHFMSDCGLSVWQMLPLGPTHIDGSPYQCLSAHAGNPELINLDWLITQGWLTVENLERADVENSTPALLKKAGDRFFKHADSHWLARFNEFVKQADYWLPHFSLFMALKQSYNNNPWTKWPLCYRFREAEALKDAEQQHAKAIKTIEFSQFVFFMQWRELKKYAQSLDIKLFGDMPIYVSLDSADVWAHKENFLMSRDGFCDTVAGVPPDGFSDDGQLWGNPLYDWEAQQKQGFSWWTDRFKTQLVLFDLIRIDHFRGLQACWHIQSDAATAAEGKWVQTPGKELLHRLHQHFNPLPVIAEDLGFITEQVEALRNHYNLPGMAVLQFAFDGLPNNPYLPHNHKQNSVVYTGTHDNDTSSGWLQHLDQGATKQLTDYMGQSEFNHTDMPWMLNRMALSSVAGLAIIPMQDLLGLDSGHRMNTPGTTEGNWGWRFDWSQVWPELAGDLRNMVWLYGRLAKN